MVSPQFRVGELNELRRKPERGDYRHSVAYAILDEAVVAHVGITDEGAVVVIPMVFGRDRDRLLLHGSVASRLLRALDNGVALCATVTVLDGLVLARSQRNHSVNYRSVMVFGTGRRLHGHDAAEALARIVNHAVPGRSAEARAPTDRELAETLVMEVPIEVASVKVRSGPPLPLSPDDLEVDAWTGVLPLALTARAPHVDVATSSQAQPPPSLSPWRRPSQTETT